MPRYLRFTFLFLAFIPYALKLPYMSRAWVLSQQDRYDWIFLALFAVLFPLVWFHTRKRRQVATVDYYALIVLLPASASYVLFFLLSINALQILAGVAIALSVFWMIYGGQNTYRIFPCFGILALSVTSTTYWINYQISSPYVLYGLLVKLFLGAILFLWLCFNCLWEKKASSGSLLFAGAVCLAFLLVLKHEDSSSLKSAPVILRLSEGSTGNFLGRRQEVTAHDIRFFGADSQIDKFYYVSENTGIYLLALTCGRKVNAIHPASHCLRSSGWTVFSENNVETDIGKKIFYANEITAEKQGARYLFWVWYSNARYSTPSFMYFRRCWNVHEQWHAYQIMIPLKNDSESSIAEARSKLKEFLLTVIQPYEIYKKKPPQIETD